MTFTKKYHQTQGTHCWFCEREFNVDRNIYVRCGSPLQRTREHIIPKSKLKAAISRNYIASCIDCNTMKGKKNARDFASHINDLILSRNSGTHNMYKYFKKMKDRAWKLYNKTSKMHKQYCK